MSYGNTINVFDYLSSAQQTSVKAWTGVDVTSAINTAIEAIPSVGGQLVFPPGRYVTSGGLHS